MAHQDARNQPTDSGQSVLETEALLRQRLPAEIAGFSWQSQQQQQFLQLEHQQQFEQQQQRLAQQQQQQAHAPSQAQTQEMAPPPTPPIQQQLPYPSGPVSAQSPVPEVATSRSTTAGRARGRGRGSGVARTVRRRKTSLSLKEESDGSISEEFTMEGVKTKSGRKVHRPAHFNPAQKTPSRRRGPYRRNYDARICRICQRGHSPQSNMIVFCDGCNTPYHQLCHDPAIDDLVIAVESAEWFCANCAKLREQRPLTMGLSGSELTEEEKRIYLANLPMSSLVDLIFHCETQHPDLTIYDPQTREIVANLKRTSTAKTTGDNESPGVNDNISMAGDVDADMQGPNWEELIIRSIEVLEGTGKSTQPKNIFEWIGESYPALEGRDIRAEAQPSLQAAHRKRRLLREGHAYKINPDYAPSILFALPKSTTDPGIVTPGSGIKLPLETEDDDMLIDDDLIAFSHRYASSKLTGGNETMDGIVSNGIGGGPVAVDVK